MVLLGQHSVAIVQGEMKRDCSRDPFHPEPDSGVNQDEIRFGEVDE